VTESPSIIVMIVGFLLVLGPLVVLHELGHYAVGRLFGVKADVFSVGFGKEIFGRTDRRGTRWKLSAIPLGGYVQFAGDMNPASQPSPEWLSLPASERAMTFQAKPLWQRALIVAAGPLTNMVVAVAIFAAFFVAFGKEVTSPVVARFAEQSTAREAGLQVGDRIAAVDGQDVPSFSGLARRIELYPGEVVQLSVIRGGERQVFSVPIASTWIKDQFGNSARVGRIGIMSEGLEWKKVGPGEAVVLAFEHCGAIVRMMVAGIGQILTGQRSVDELGGPIKIAKYSGEQLSLGPLVFVQFVALISINLAFINLLPIPALDGGHLAFYAAEAVRRKPLGPRSQEWAYRTGIAFVLALMLFVTINDVASLLSFGS
jgi:regulator of sigma E protease